MMDYNLPSPAGLPEELLPQQAQQQAPQQEQPQEPQQPPQPHGMGLEDLFTLAIPAVAGSMAGSRVGGRNAGSLGMMAGLGEGADQIREDQVRQVELQQKQNESDYRRALMSHAQAETENLQLKDRELRTQMKSRDDFLATLTDPKERDLFVRDPEEYRKYALSKEALPGSLKVLQDGGLKPDDLAGFSPSDIHEMATERMKARVMGIGREPQMKTMPDGTRVIYSVDAKGEPKFYQPKASNVASGIETKREFNRQTGHFEDVGVEKATGKEAWRREAGDEKMTSAEKMALNSEIAGIHQADRLLDNLSKIDVKDASKMAWEGLKYGHATAAGVVGQLTGGLVGGFDPKYVEIFSNQGQLEAALQRALTSGRVNQKLYDRLIQHVPQTGEPPEITSEKLKSLLEDKGLMKDMRDIIKGEVADVDKEEKAAKSGPAKAGAAPTYKTVEEFKKANPGVELEPVD